MKVTGTLVLLCCLLLLVPASGARARSASRGRARGRALRRLATAGLLFGAGTAFGAALARGRRDVSLEEPAETEELDEGLVLASLRQADTQHCMEQWLCDIMARTEEQQAEEERDMAQLFVEEVAAGQLGQPGSPRAVYLAAAARGLGAADRSVCQLSSCPVQPDQLLRQLRATERAARLLE